jgi:hypothetical protein
MLSSYRAAAEDLIFPCPFGTVEKSVTDIKWAFTSQ